ncbi:MAG: peptidylprolyl isomerase [Thermofilum sp.]
MSGQGAAKGDFLLVDYTLSVLEETGERVIVTTSSERGEEAAGESEPELVILGEGRLLQAIEEALSGMKEGEAREIVLEPRDAFGERDPRNVIILPAKELSSRGVVPRVGEEIEIEGRRGRIIRVGAGRVTVDFNNPYAGKKVKAKLAVRKVLREDSEKIVELLRRWFRGLPRERVSVSLQGNTAEIKVPLAIFAYSNAHILLSGFIRDLEKYFSGITVIRLVEEERIGKAEGEAQAAQSQSEKASSSGGEASA